MRISDYDIVIDEYTCDALNDISLSSQGWLVHGLKVGVSPVAHRGKVKYKDANWMK